jgi:hypothetical protein
MKIREFLLDNNVGWHEDSRAVREEFAALINEATGCEEDDQQEMFLTLNGCVKRCCDAYLHTSPEDISGKAEIKFLMKSYARDFNETFREE